TRRIPPPAPAAADRTAASTPRWRTRTSPAAAGFPNGFPSGPVRSEGVALGDRAALQAGLEPARTLLGRPVSEAFRHDHALGASLDVVVADGGRRVERLLDVTLLEPVARLLGVVRPDAGIAVGLELE